MLLLGFGERAVLV